MDGRFRRIFILLLFNLFFALLAVCGKHLAHRKLKCPTACNVQVQRKSWFNNSDTQSEDELVSKQCAFVSDTLKCESLAESYAAQSFIVSVNVGNSSPPIDDEPLKIFDVADTQHRPCGVEAFDIFISPFVYRDPNYPPFVRVNASLQLWDMKTRAVAFRHTCVSSGPGVEEDLCKNHSRPSWPRFYWPCRMFDLSEALDEFEDEQLTIPSTFTYECFGAAPLSVMTLRVALYPQMCESSFVYRIPSYHNLVAVAIEEWLPLVFVDTRAEQGVKVHFSIPDQVLPTVQTIVVEIVDRHTNDVVRSKTVEATKRAVFIGDLKKGEYSALVLAWHARCVDSRCANSHVPFNLTRDYLETAASVPSASNKVWLGVGLTIVVLVITVIAVFALISLFYRLKYRRRRRSAVTIQFAERPKIFIVYTDDTVFHRNCVISLAEYLRDAANCDVYLDEWAFRNGSTRSGHTTTAEWVINNMAQSDYFLLIFSEGCKVAFNAPRTKELRTERPWREIFGLAMTYVLEEILRQTRDDPRTKLKKIICSTFRPYSGDDCLPSLFRSLPCSRYFLLDDLAELICHLHKLTPESFDVTAPLGCERVASEIERARRYYEANPSWLNERTVRLDVVNGQPDGGAISIANISAAIESLQMHGAESSTPRVSLTDLYDDSKHFSSGKYPLLPPSSRQNNLMNGSAKKFALLPPDEEDIDDDQQGNADSNGAVHLPLMTANGTVPADHRRHSSDNGYKMGSSSGETSCTSSNSKARNHAGCSTAHTCL